MQQNTSVIVIVFFRSGCRKIRNSGNASRSSDRMMDLKELRSSSCFIKYILKNTISMILDVSVGWNCRPPNSIQRAAPWEDVPKSRTRVSMMAFAA